MKRIQYFISIALSVTLLICFNPLYGTMSFDNYNVKSIHCFDKLPSSKVNCIFEDSQGYIWFGTSHGLSRYDGYTVKNYYSSYLLPNLLSNNFVTTISEDKYKQLWIGTLDGLNILDIKTGKIRKIKKEKLNGNVIWDLIRTKDNTMWVATQYGLHKYDEERESFDVYLNNSNDTKTISGNDIRTVFEDSKGDLWLGIWNMGICRYDKQKDEFIAYPWVVGENRVIKFFEDRDKQIWFSAWTNGLYKIINPVDSGEIIYEQYWISTDYEKVLNCITENKDGSLLLATNFGLDILLDKNNPETYITADENDIWDIPAGNITTVFTDSKDITWLAVENEDVMLIFQEIKKFNVPVLKPIANFNQDISILSFFNWSEDELLVGIEKIGLGIYHKRKHTLTPYFEDSRFNLLNRYIGNVVCAFKHPTRDEVWLGSEYGGLHIMEIRDCKVISCKQYYPQSGCWLLGDVIRDICLDNANNIWIGTNNGLNIITPHEEVISLVNLNQKYQVEVQCIIKRSNGDMVIGTKKNGVFMCNVAEGLENLLLIHYSKEDDAINNNEIRCLYEDSEQRLWAGTNSGGLSLFNEENKRFQIIKNMNYIPGDVINSITEENGILFIGTNQGLVRYNPNSNPGDVYLTVYRKEDGLPDNNFNQGAVGRCLDGRLVFGTTRGLVFFSMSDLELDVGKMKKNNSVIFTDIKLFNNSFELLDERQQKRLSPNMHPSFSKQITLSYQDYSFGIEFSSLNYKYPEKIRYMYMLEGLDQDWNSADANQRLVYYTNLNKGTYNFFVKEVNEYGYTSSDYAVMSIKVLPPFYLSSFALIIYVLLLFLISLFLFRYFRFKIRMHQALKIERLERTKSEELNQEKLQFFTNITHELLTPLALINCSVEDLESGYNNQDSSDDIFHILKSNIFKLNRLLEQILEFRKAEKNILKLSVSQGDFALHIQKICTESFVILGKNEQIKLSFKSPSETIMGWFDKDKVDKITFNLLSNAFKYNKLQGEVVVTLQPENFIGNNQYKSIILSIKNTGMGINPQHIESVFERFHSIEYKNSNKKGNGIGLALTKSLVELHHGSISVHSTPGEWTEFLIHLPLDKTAYSPDQIAD